MANVERSLMTGLFVALTCGAFVLPACSDDAATTAGTGGSGGNTGTGGATGTGGGGTGGTVTGDGGPTASKCLGHYVAPTGKCGTIDDFEADTTGTGPTT